MIRRRLVVVLVSVLCLPTTAAFAQDDAERMAEVICAGDPECLTLAKYRLTADNLRRMFAADRELVTLLNAAPELEERMSSLARSLDPQRRVGKVTLSAQVHEGIPEIAQVLRRHHISAREYAFTHAVAMVTAMTDVTFSYEAQHGGRNAPMTQALKFWRAMDPALKAEADAWKKMRGYDQGINRWPAAP